MKNKHSRMYIFAYNVEPNGISGGETILIETFKRIASRFTYVDIYCWGPSHDLYTTYGLVGVNYIISPILVIKNFYASFILRTFFGIYKGITLHINKDEVNYLYFSSDFLPDALAVILLKLRYPKSIFIGNFFLAAPNPFKGFNENGRIRFPSLNGIFFWITQKPVYFFTKYYADLILITSLPDIIRFPKQSKKDAYYIVKGGVNLESIRKFEKKNKNIKKENDAIFIGRFHPQKGVSQLIDIWKLVVRKKPDARLVMIGDGPLFKTIKNKIKILQLTKNIILTGYIFDATKRYMLYMQSKIILHPAVYDSGGMAITEAMALGLPGISFDLEALKTYYPTGVLKVTLNDFAGFADKIIALLDNQTLYRKTQINAISLIESEWDWNKRATELADKIFSIKK